MHEQDMSAPFPTDLQKWEIITETDLSESYCRKTPISKIIISL